MMKFGKKVVKEGSKVVLAALVVDYMGERHDSMVENVKT
jgi:hypothetical protein